MKHQKGNQRSVRGQRLSKFRLSLLTAALCAGLSSNTSSGQNAPPSAPAASRPSASIPASAAATSSRPEGKRVPPPQWAIESQLNKRGENLSRRVRGVMAQQLDLPLSAIKAKSSIYDLGGDSLDIVEAIMALENEFKIDIPDSMCDVPDIDAFINIVRKLTSKRSTIK